MSKKSKPLVFAIIPTESYQKTFDLLTEILAEYPRAHLWMQLKENLPDQPNLRKIEGLQEISPRLHITPSVKTPAETGLLDTLFWQCLSLQLKPTELIIINDSIIGKLSKTPEKIWNKKLHELILENSFQLKKETDNNLEKYPFSLAEEKWLTQKDSLKEQEQLRQIFHRKDFKRINLPPKLQPKLRKIMLFTLLGITITLGTISLPKNKRNSVISPEISPTPENIQPSPTPLIDPCAITDLQPEETPLILEIPSINLYLDIVLAPLKNGTWSTEDKKANFAEGTSLPNDVQGNTAIFGHDRRNAMTDIKKLNSGDEIFIYTENYLFTYTVEEISQVNPTDVEIFENHGKKELTLMTCDGLFSQKRLAVFTTLQKMEKINCLPN